MDIKQIFYLLAVTFVTVLVISSAVYGMDGRRKGVRKTGKLGRHGKVLYGANSGDRSDSDEDKSVRQEDAPKTEQIQQHLVASEIKPDASDIEPGPSEQLLEHQRVSFGLEPDSTSTYITMNQFQPGRHEKVVAPSRPIHNTQTTFKPSGYNKIYHKFNAPRHNEKNSPKKPIHNPQNKFKESVHVQIRNPAKPTNHVPLRHPDYDKKPPCHCRIL